MTKMIDVEFFRRFLPLNLANGVLLKMIGAKVVPTPTFLFQVFKI